MTSVVQIVAGPILGIIMVVFAYLLGIFNFKGIFLSIKCCQPKLERNPSGESDSTTGRTGRQFLNPGLHGGFPGLDIFIVARSEEYLVTIPRPISPRPVSSGRHNQETLVPALPPSHSPAPDYEEPPTYEDCIENGLV